MPNASKKRTGKPTIVPLVFIVLGILQGCQNENKRPKPLDMSNGALYLNNQLYRKLYVEIDTLEGTQVPPVLIEEVREFLNEHCSKPGGIIIVQDPPVSFDQKELSIGLMSVLCTDGPPDHLKGQAAYLHVFFYDTDLEIVKSFSDNPYVSAYCPTTVFLNVDYAKIYHNSLARHFVRHEIGHVLGLCANTSHGDGGHCDNRNCLMHKSPDSLSQLSTLVQIPMKDKEFCTECLTDICNMKTLLPNDPLSFNGPFWVKENEEDMIYQLPYYRLMITKDEASSVGWKELLSKSKSEIEKNLDQFIEDIKNRKHEIPLYGVYEP